MWGLGEVEEIFKTAPREHAAISPTVRTAKGKARKLTRHSCFKWRVDLQGKKKVVLQACVPWLPEKLLQIPSQGKYTKSVPPGFLQIRVKEKNLMNKVHQTLMKMSHYTQSQQKQ